MFEKLIPADHYLRRLKAALNFEPVRDLVADWYAEGLGAPAEDPLCMLKLRLLQFQYDLSDSNVLRQAQGNVAFRFLLDLSLESRLPVPSLLWQFRTRLGVERFTRVFDESLRQGRAQGLVKDRRRLQEATPLLANLALPSPLPLVAQTREQWRTAAEGFAASEVAAHRAQVEAVRAATADWKEEQRLVARVTPLRELVTWGERWQRRWQPAAARDAPLVREEQAAAVSAAVAVAHEGLNDREPAAADKLRSLADRDARPGKHGAYYEGYLLDMSGEADSELICAVEVLPATGEEAAHAKNLSASAEHAPGNDLASLSVDRIGDRGEVRAAVSEAADGPRLTVSVPPIDWPPPAPELFQPAAFTRNAAGEEVRCPGGATPGTRQRARRGHGWQLRFRPSQCRPCPLRARGLKPDTPGGRPVIKTDYAAQYRAAQQRAQTAADQAVRRQQPRIARKLADLLRWHAGRRGR